MSYQYIQTVVSEFGTLFSLDLDISRGAVCLQRSDGSRWYLEIIDDAMGLIIHTDIGSSHDLTYDNISKLMELNSNLPLMKGAWFGIHEETASYRLFQKIALAEMSSNLLDNETKKLISLRNMLMEENYF
ncbi:type III secretion system chaperone [Serratia sp. M24T3]|uniref:type III secretion system chaperone n=1 Tax=Serratia sp. M24T3 TaxID=932213 RepID=UPI00025B9B79|nr:type III secretion system chaperone [Serratia sp. M24T3]EIC85958.1 hypothetical protein SPM24T3_04082 [Serratia sp. M24T3]